MPQVVVASTNPVKIQAAIQAFTQMFPDQAFTFEGISVPSGVSDQPKSDQETLQGAQNRVQNASTLKPDADFWIGLEGGIEDIQGEMHAFAWIVIKSNEGLSGKGKTGVFILPPKVRELIIGGMELGKADDVVFNKNNSKQENGAVGILTSNAIDRASYYTHAAILALIPFKNKNFFQ